MIDDVGLLQIVGPDGPAMFFDVVKHPLTNAAYQPSSRPTALFPPGELQFILPAHLGAPPEHRSGPLRGGDDSFPTQGVSTRAVDDLVVALGIDTGISKSEVSRICKRLDEHVDAFRNRTLGHTPFPYVYLDATYVNVRDTGLGQVVSKAIVIATGITVGGDREILGLSESEAFWGEFCRALRRRGLAGRLVISDAHDGLKAAIRKHFTGASWQRCRGIVPSSGLCRAGAGMVRVASTSG